MDAPSETFRVELVDEGEQLFHQIYVSGDVRVPWLDRPFCQLQYNSTQMQAHENDNILYAQMVDHLVRLFCPCFWLMIVCLYMYQLAGASVPTSGHTGEAFDCVAFLRSRTRSACDSRDVVRRVLEIHARGEVAVVRMLSGCPLCFVWVRFFYFLVHSLGFSHGTHVVFYSVLFLYLFMVGFKGYVFKTNFVLTWGVMFRS